MSPAAVGGDAKVSRKTVKHDPADVAALALLQNYLADALPRIQKRAEKWIAGLVAMTGVLTTAVVIKGPDSFGDLTGSRKIFGQPVSSQDAVIYLILAGGIAVALGIYWSYSAAYGDPREDDALLARAKDQDVDGAWDAWTTAASQAVTEASESLVNATRATVIGIICLALAILITWTSPTNAAAESFTCFKSGTETIKIEGSAPTVSDGELTIVPCPS